MTTQLSPVVESPAGLPLPTAFAVGPECTALEIFSEKWSVSVLYTLERFGGTLRFRAIQRSAPPSGGRPISARMLALTLRHLQAASLVTRATFDVVPPRVEYSLTTKAREIMGTLDTLHQQLGSHCHETGAASAT